MNKAMIFTLGALIGGALGGFVGYKYGKKKVTDDIYEDAHKKADEEIDAMRAYYNDLYKLSDKYVSKDSKKPEDEEETEEDPRNFEVKHDYTGHFDDPAESEHPEEDEEEFDDTGEEPEINDFYETNKTRAPRLISIEDLEDLPAGYENQVLFYYTEDEQISDDDGNLITDYEKFIGDCLYKYDFAHSDETLIFVINYEYSTVYEITKVMSSYADEYLN